MKNTLAPLAGIGSSEDRRSNIMALLDLYGASYLQTPFVCANLNKLIIASTLPTGTMISFGIA